MSFIQERITKTLIATALPSTLLAEVNFDSEDAYTLEHLSFHLSDDFVSLYSDRAVKWGFSDERGVSFGEMVYARTYSRRKADGTKERWHETCRRVVEGMYSYLKDHLENRDLAYDAPLLQQQAEKTYDDLFNLRWTPPGRGLWACGSEYVSSRQTSSPLFNCAFLSTHDDEDPALPYYRLADMLMMGCGVGFDTAGAGQYVEGPSGERRVTIADSREGWVDSVALLMDAFFEGSRLPVFSYREVREKDVPIKGFGGVSGGPGPLREMHERIVSILSVRIGEELTTRDVVDLMNVIGIGIISGNVRRGAEIALGEIDDEEFRNLKDYTLPGNEARAAWGWMSNNTLIVRDGDRPDYDEISKTIRVNGEPGLFYIDEARQMGRMSEVPRGDDTRVIGTNPCAEALLENHELCCLAEIPLNRLKTFEEFKGAIENAYRYAKIATLLDTSWDETNEVIHRNRRLGVSVTGVVQFVSRHGEKVLTRWLRDGYAHIQNLDREFSASVGVEESIRLTSVKPSGTVSNLTGSTPGVHFPVADTYIRRMRLSDTSPLVSEFRRAGYNVEADVMSAETSVVEVPIRGEGLPTEREVSVWEKAHLAQLLASEWADQAVSCTVTFLPEEADELADVMREGEGRWKTASFLPLTEDETPYPQMPYERISERTYLEMTRNLKPVDTAGLYDDVRVIRFGEIPEEIIESEGDKFCDSDSCTI